MYVNTYTRINTLHKWKLAFSEQNMWAEVEFFWGKGGDWGVQTPYGTHTGFNDESMVFAPFPPTFGQTCRFPAFEAE